MHFIYSKPFQLLTECIFCHPPNGQNACETTTKWPLCNTSREWFAFISKQFLFSSKFWFLIVDAAQNYWELYDWLTNFCIFQRPATVKAAGCFRAWSAHFAQNSSWNFYFAFFLLLQIKLLIKSNLYSLPY